MKPLWDKAKAWNWLKAASDYVYDPPPHHIRYWVVVVLGIAVGGAWFGGALVSWFDRSVLGPLHTAMYPVAQPAEPTLLLPKGAVIPSAMPKTADLPPLKPIVAKEDESKVGPLPSAPPVKLYKAKPKASSGSPFPQ